MRNPLKELQKANSAVEHSIDRLDFEGSISFKRRCGKSSPPC